jgi:hypothetical protein
MYRLSCFAGDEDKYSLSSTDDLVIAGPATSSRSSSNANESEMKRR